MFGVSRGGFEVLHSEVLHLELAGGVLMEQPVQLEVPAVVTRHLG